MVSLKDDGCVLRVLRGTEQAGRRNSRDSKLSAYEVSGSGLGGRKTNGVCEKNGFQGSILVPVSLESCKVYQGTRLLIQRSESKNRVHIGCVWHLRSGTVTVFTTGPDASTERKPARSVVAARTNVVKGAGVTMEQYLSQRG